MIAIFTIVKSTGSGGKRILSESDSPSGMIRDSIGWDYALDAAGNHLEAAEAHLADWLPLLTLVGSAPAPHQTGVWVHLAASSEE